MHTIITQRILEVIWENIINVLTGILIHRLWWNQPATSPSDARESDRARGDGRTRWRKPISMAYVHVIRVCGAWRRLIDCVVIAKNSLPVASGTPLDLSTVCLCCCSYILQRTTRTRRGGLKQLLYWWILPPQEKENLTDALLVGGVGGFKLQWNVFMVLYKCDMTLIRRTQMNTEIKQAGCI